MSIRSIAKHGMEVRYHHDRVVVNSQLDSIQAAVLEAKLPHLDGYIAARQAAAAYYDAALGHCPKVEIPVKREYSDHVYHQYTLKLKGVDRSAVQQRLSERGVPAMVYYPIPLHLQKAYASERYRAGDFPVAEHLSDCVLSLPMHTALDDVQLAYLVQSVLVS